MPKFKEKVITIADEIEQEGKEKGIRAGKLETASRMKEEGSTLEFIIKVTGLSQEELKEAGVLE